MIANLSKLSGEDTDFLDTQVASIIDANFGEIIEKFIEVDTKNVEERLEKTAVIEVVDAVEEKLK